MILHFLDSYPVILNRSSKSPYQLFHDKLRTTQPLLVTTRGNISVSRLKLTISTCSFCPNPIEMNWLVMWELFFSRKVRIEVAYHFCCDLKGPWLARGLLKFCDDGTNNEDVYSQNLIDWIQIGEDHYNSLQPSPRFNNDISKTFDDAPNRVLTVARVEYPNLYIPFWPYRTWALFVDRLRWEVAVIWESLEVNEVCWLGMAMRLTCVYRCTYV